MWVGEEISGSVRSEKAHKRVQGDRAGQTDKGPSTRASGSKASTTAGASDGNGNAFAAEGKRIETFIGNVWETGSRDGWAPQTGTPGVFRGVRKDKQFQCKR